MHFGQKYSDDSLYSYTISQGHLIIIFISLHVVGFYPEEFTPDGVLLSLYSYVRRCVCTSVHLYIHTENFGPQVYPKGFLVIALLHPLVRQLVHPFLNISEIVHRFFLFFFMKFGHRKGAKVTAQFLKKILEGHKWGKTPFGGIFYVFCQYLKKRL